MKANRAFKNEDEAVSPVIATILMVAITVVLAATVYVWVSGFGAAPQNPAKTIGLTSDAPLAGNLKTYTIASATSGLKWEDVRVTIDGVEQFITMAPSTCPPAVDGYFTVCHGATTEISTETVDGGDSLKIFATPHQTLRILDISANSVIVTLNIG